MEIDMKKMLKTSLRRKKKKKIFLNIEELERLVRDIRGEKTRSSRSYELEAMTIRLRDVKHFSNEDVEEIMNIHANDWLYKVYFSWFWDHLNKVIVLLTVISWEVYFFGWFITLVGLIPVTGAVIIIFLYLVISRGKI